jgi:hypothetical protein
MRAMEEKGAAVVEFAVVFPLIALLIGAIIMFGLALSSQLVMQQAAREGVRVYALGDGDPRAAAGSVLGGMAASVSMSGCPNPVDPDGDGVPGVSAGSSGPQAKVTITRNFTLGIPFFPISSIPLTARAVMRCGG